MAVDSILRTYGDVSIRESVLGMIEILTATEDNIQTSIRKTKASAGVHATLLDTLRTVADAAVGEGEDYTMSANSTPTRLSNVVQTTAIPFAVTRFQQSVNHFNGENELVRQTQKAMKDYSNSVEFSLVRNTLVSGVSGTAPKAEGLIAHISKSTNTTVQTSGTVWSASILKGLMKANWDSSNGETATDLYMGSILKNNTDDFVNKSTNVVTGTNVKEIVSSVDVFETGLGKVRVHAHRYVDIAGTDATCRVLGLNLDKHAIAYLYEPFVDKDLARSGPYDKYAVAGAWTLETRNQDSNFFASGYLRS
jgi:hypothetical protein